MDCNCTLSRNLILGGDLITVEGCLHDRKAVVTTLKLPHGNLTEVSKQRLTVGFGVVQVNYLGMPYLMPPGHVRDMIDFPMWPEAW